MNNFCRPLLAIAASRWPSDLSETMRNEWEAELVAIGTQDPHPIRSRWQQFQFSFSLASSPPPNGVGACPNLMRTGILRAKQGIGHAVMLSGIGAVLYVCMVMLTVSTELIRNVASSAINVVAVAVVVELAIAVLMAWLAGRPYVCDARVAPVFAMFALVSGAMAPQVLSETLFFGVPTGFLAGLAPSLAVLAGCALVVLCVWKLAKHGYAMWAWLLGGGVIYLVLDVATLLSKPTNFEIWQAPIAVLWKAVPGAGVYEPGLRDLVWTFPAAAFILAYTVKAGSTAFRDHSGIEADGPTRSDPRAYTATEQPAHTSPGESDTAAAPVPQRNQREETPATAKRFSKLIAYGSVSLCALLLPVGLHVVQMYFASAVHSLSGWQPLLIFNVVSVIISISTIGGAIWAGQRSEFALGSPYLYLLSFVIFGLVPTWFSDVLVRLPGHEPIGAFALLGVAAFAVAIGLVRIVSAVARHGRTGMAWLVAAAGTYLLVVAGSAGWRLLSASSDSDWAFIPLQPVPIASVWSLAEVPGVYAWSIVVFSGFIAAHIIAPYRTRSHVSGEVS